MTVERKAIRCRLADKLRGRTIAGELVGRNRFEVIRPQNSGPVRLTVFTLHETVEQHADTPRTYLRLLEVAVEIFLERGTLDSDALDDLLDEACDQVECIIEPEIVQLDGMEIDGAPSLSVNPSRSGLERVELDFDTQGRQLAGAARLVFVVAYGTDVDEREQARARDLEGATVRYQFPVPDGEPVEAAQQELDTPPA